MAQAQIQDEQYPNPPQPGGAMWDGVQIGSPEYVAKIEQQLKDAGGSLYDPSDLEGFIRNATNNNGTGWAGAGTALQSQLDIYKKRAASNGGGGAPSTAGASGASAPPFNFDDPSTTQLESIARNQMGEIRSNPGLDALNKFLESQFNELSTAPGYSNDELALLNTQAFEPIEQLRKADTQRSMERTAARGFLPSSGLAELDLRDVDERANRLRTQASRDLAIGAIDRRDADLNQALKLAQLRGLTIPQGQRAEELNLSQLLYQLPRNALQDVLAVLQGSPTAGQVGSQAYNLANLDQMNRNNNMQRWNQIAQLLAGLF